MLLLRPPAAATVRLLSAAKPESNESSPALRSGTRIHIIGGPGSGKTTLASRLSAVLGIPAYPLDEVAFRHGFGRSLRLSCPLEERLVEVERISRRRAWITEGSYLWWTRELLESADIIVLLDVPRGTAIRRILRRHIFSYFQYLLSNRDAHWWVYKLRHPGLRIKWDLIRAAVNYYSADGLRAPSNNELDDIFDVNRLTTIHELQKYAAKLVVWTGASGAEDIANTPR